jgi:two-component system response regulator YesN
MGMESQLKNAIQLGDEDSAKTILDDLFRENIDNRKLDAAMRSILLFDVVSTTVKALDEIHCARDEVQETIASIMERRDSCDRSMDAGDIAELVLMACRSCRNRTTDHTGKLLEEMVQFIDCHISDPNLSLQGAAASLSISEVHLSRVFSSRMGRPFREYIEESRMCRAKEMLQTTQLPIKEIAFAVGYRSMNTFSRAFSRKNGSTASSFRS